MTTLQKNATPKGESGGMPHPPENFEITIVKEKSQLAVSCQVMTDPNLSGCCGLLVTFCSFILHLIGHETINIPEIFSGVHSLTGKNVRGRIVC